MLKRILTGSVLALALAGCGGNGGSSGTAYMYGINAVPNVGSLTITANGTTVLNDAGYDSISSQTGVSSGNNASIYLTNSSSSQLASGQTNLNNNEYYTAFAIGNSASQYLFFYPINVTISGLMYVNCSVLQSSVDVYVYPSGSSTIGTPINTTGAVNPFDSGVMYTTNWVAGTTYTVQFNISGTSTVLSTVSVTASATQVSLVALEDSPTGTTPDQTAYSYPITTNASATVPKDRPFVLGHPGMTAFPASMTKIK